ncbi:hypothetical protein Godav_028857, partial [Gossypium davidsonii]|nr:hypothetical protein [Gossypium davidsonii]
MDYFWPIPNVSSMFIIFLSIRRSPLVVWVRLFGLSEGLYNKCLLKAIGETIGPMLRIDHNTENGIRGRFARLVVCVDLSKPLISKLKISGKTQRVEYESLPNVCFGCGRFGYNKDFCPHHPSDESKEGGLKDQPKSKGEELHKRVEEEQFGPWMLVERRQWRSSRTTTYNSSMVVDKTVGGSRIGVLDGSFGENNGENDSFDTINAEKDDARME